MDIRFDVANARQVGLRFDAFPEDLRADLGDAIDELSQELLALIQGRTPDRTGLLRSQERLRRFDDPNRITGYIDIAGQGSGKGSDFAKAAALEYGAHGSAKVVSYVRGGDRRSWLERAFNVPHDNIVRAYTRTVDIEEYAFERGPLAEMQPAIAARLNAAVATAVEGANA